MTLPRTPRPPAIVLDRVSVRFGGHLALDGVSLELFRGEVAVLIGANGAGKSTLIDVLAGVRPADGGVVRRSAPDRVAIVPQQTRTVERLPVTVRDLVSLGCWARCGLWRPLGRRDRDDVDRAMERLAISDLADRPITALSGGQRQRAFLAQGLTQRADVLLLDEPATGLDADSVDLVLSAIRGEADRGVAVVIATHDQETRSLADSVVTLRGGRVDPAHFRG